MLPSPIGGGERGSAAVEFALVLPILLILALALVQVGLLARDQLVLVQAARAGAREAAVSPDPGRVRGAVVDGGPGLAPGALRIGIERGGGRGEPVTVALGYSARTRVPLVDWLFPPAVSLSARATMRQEFP